MAENLVKDSAARLWEMTSAFEKTRNNIQQVQM